MKASQEAHEALDEWDRMNHLVDPDTITIQDVRERVSGPGGRNGKGLRVARVPHVELSALSSRIPRPRDGSRDGKVDIR